MPPAGHYEFLVEEPSMEAFLRAWMPRHLPGGVSFDVKVFQGKPDLLGKLEPRLRGYCARLPSDWRLVVIVDRDDDDCAALKHIMERICTDAGLQTRRAQRDAWRAATCIAIEELEAWYFGDWKAVVEAYPNVSAQIARQARYRAPDAIAHGTWEAFERVLQRYGYHKGALQKVRAAREIGALVEAERNRSPSFRNLLRAIDEGLK
jgi:hypothetical protein